MSRILIILGIFLFLVGIYADFALASWSKAVLISSTVSMFAGVFLWLLSGENRRKLMQSVPIMSSTSIGDVTISSHTENNKRALRRAGAPYYSVMSFCFFMIVLHGMTFFIHRSPLYATAVQLIKTDEEIMTKVGEVIDYSYAAVGVIHESGNSNLIFGVKGRNGTYWVQATFNSVDNVPTLEQVLPIASADGLFGK